MRKVTGGNGQDTTAAVLAWLAAHKELRLANLYLIGEADDPAALWLTDYESPLLWSCWGTFLSTVIKRGSVTSKVGVEVESLELTWSPKNSALTASIATASPYQLARLGAFDNKRVRVWRCLMPTAGDANTFGAFELFGGYIGDVQPTRGSIRFTVNSYLYAINQKVPSGVIEVTDAVTGYTGWTVPHGFSQMPRFAIFAGSTPGILICDQVTPNAGNIPSGNVLRDGSVVFDGGAGQTLAGQYSIIANNGAYTDGNGNHHTQIILFSPLPWAPTPGVDTFFVSGDSPIGTNLGFPYVPSPASAV